MWLDLDPKRWPENKALDKHPLIHDLFQGGNKDDGSNALDPEPPIDIDEDPNIADLPIIFDADSSQHTVLVDALSYRCHS